MCVELQTSLIVILLTAAVAGGVLWAAHAAEKRRLLALQKACDIRGWRCRIIRERLKKAFEVNADGWRLETGSQAADPGSQSGAADVVRYTVWESAPVGRDTGLHLRFGTLPGGNSWKPDRLDPPNAYGNLLSPSGIAAALRLQPLPGGRFLFALESDGDEETWRQALSESLAGWPDGLPLNGKMEGGILRLSVTGKRLDQPEEFEPIIHLGEALIRRMGAVEFQQPT